MPFVVIVGATILNRSKRQDAVTAELRDLYTKRLRVESSVIFSMANGDTDIVGKVLRRRFWLIPELIKRRYVLPKFTVLHCVIFTDLDISSSHSQMYFSKMIAGQDLIYLPSQGLRNRGK